MTRAGRTTGSFAAARVALAASRRGQRSPLSQGAGTDNNRQVFRGSLRGS